MESLYSNEIRRFIKSQPWPARLEWRVVERSTPDTGPFLQFVLFRDNINALDSDDKLHLAKLLNEVLHGVQKNGVPIYTEVAKGDGRSERA